MASGKYQESSSSQFARCKYQVLLSFRGEDTRKNFTDHLYTALEKQGIHTFRDDDEIQRGENIDLEIQQAIQQSKLSIIVFSKDYASSRWCLDELVMIMERRRTGSCIVFPVFYDVDPSQVKKQTDSFAAAFAEHEKNLKEEMERVNGWRIALEKATDLGGMILGDGYEAQFVQSIVEKVSNKLDRKIFNVPLQFIGRDPLINYITSWLQDGSDGAAIAVLYGIGGVGKTAIAKSVYNDNFHKFESRSFLSNVRERAEAPNGVVCLQRKLLSDILNKTVDEIQDVDEGIVKINDVLCCRRTLIVLDDVDKRDHFNTIVDMKNWLCQGSKIIVTTRNKSWIAANDEFVECKVDLLDNEKSLELFSWHAFGQAHPVEDFIDLSWRIVHHCSGLPLAHRVIGSSLFGKRRKVWESVLQEMEVIPNCEVQKVLRVSYDSLGDDYQKDVFLDIACFFNGMDEDYVSRILDGLGVGATYRVDNLIDRCLLEIDQNKRLSMHQLIRYMGREIARQESIKCQRIWHQMEAFTLLKETIDAEKLRGLTLDMHALLEDNCTKAVYADSMVRRKHDLFQQCRLPTFLSREWISDFFSKEQVQAGQTSLFPILSTDAFRKMQNVKFLQLNYMKFYGSYEHFPKKLIWLCWHGFCLRSIPKHFCLDKLVVLDLSRSSLVDVWKGKLCLPKLKILDLRHSHDLIRTPDFSGLSGLEKLILEECVQLVQIHESIGDLHCLVILNLKNCKSLSELPEEISRLNSLQLLHLDGCSHLDGLNMELDHHQGRRMLRSDGIFASISYITSLPLKLFVPSMFLARKIPRFTSFSLPHSLTELSLNGTPIRFLPENIKDLSTLRSLVLERCKMLQTLPELPSNLVALDVSFCESLQGLAKLIPFTRACDCDQLVQFQDLIKQELIQKADMHMFRIMEMVSVQMQPRFFKIQLRNNLFHVLVYIEGNEMLRFYDEEGEECPNHNEFGEHLSYKVSTPAAHRICGFNIYTWFSSTSELNTLTNPFILEIKNNTKGRSVAFNCFGFLLDLWVEKGWVWISHCNCGVDDLEFDDGDEVSVSVFIDDERVQIKRIGVRILHEEEGSKNDCNNIQSNNEAITSPSSSSSSSSSDSKEVITAHSRSSFRDNRTLGDGYVAKAAIASQLFRHFFCFTRYNYDLLDLYACFFEKK